ncbi:cytochrome c oxidase assembly factor CtaG [Rossellomorea aquimaris]|uniref:cytochrome c oxidase assembly factor CtaG n=1 Tax=Rossellomorea aquimaris TaxID=189382 RepID=UPI001CD23B37|nr:cytochrome c oxidase assembly factor CtaG [Rossellomorea aquimaris]MCA1053381.1 cytochrome c oxidase assembly factor CtaG [Rossellomorea aquimaris]
MPLGIFGFMALWSPFFIVALLFITVVYFLVTVKWRSSFKESEPLKRKEAIYFILAILLVYVLKGSPVEVMSTILFSAHMTQMALLFLVVAPLIVMGIPHWVWKAIISLPVVKPVFSFMTRPLIALLTFNIMFSIYHIPLIFDNVRTDVTLHGLASVILFLLSIFMWWPLLNPADEDIDLSGLKRIGYILGSAVLLTPACGLIIFAEHPLYAPYYDPEEFLKALALCVPVDTLQGMTLSGPELFTSMSTLNDQQLGGVIMKIIQEIVFGVMLFNLFFQWYRKDMEKQETQSYDPVVDPVTTE